MVAGARERAPYAVTCQAFLPKAEVPSKFRMATEDFGLRALFPCLTVLPYEVPVSNTSSVSHSGCRVVL